MTTWTTKSIPDQSGKLAIITGATDGLGLETALVLKSGQVKGTRHCMNVSSCGAEN